MVIALLNYKTSFLSTLLKIITPLIYLLALYFFVKAKKVYGMVFKDISMLLIIATSAGAVSHTFRYIGGIPATHWKWGESIFYLIFAGIMFYASFEMSKKLRKISQGGKQNV